MDGFAKDRAITPTEASAARALSAVLADRPCGELAVDSDAMRSLAGYLERFFSEVLAEVHEEWKWESFDGIDVEQAQKLSECCLQLAVWHG